MLNVRSMMRGALAAALALATLAGTATAQDRVINVGDKAPAFEGLADNGKPWRSRDHVGQKLLVVYFYPAAMTGGCTKQACMFRDNRSRLQALGADVVGVSGDRIANLKAFKGSNRLNFPLLSDTAGVVARAFGVPVKEGGQIARPMDGKQIQFTRDLTAARWTFIIDRSGKVVYKDTAVNPSGDGEDVVAVVRRLAGK